MATYLHTLDALAHLAEDDGLAAGWARVQLALRAPAIALRHPIAPLTAGVLGAAAVSRAAAADPADALLAAQFGAFLGALDPDDEALAAQLLTAAERDPSHLPGAAWLLSLMERCPRALALRAARTAEAGSAGAAAAALLSTTPPGERASLATALVTALGPFQVRSMLLSLGAPNLGGSRASDPAAAARAMLDRLGAPDRAPTPPKGSRRHRLRAVVGALLGQRDDPLSAALRAVAAAPIADALGDAPAAMAAWVAAFTPGDPIDDALRRHADTSPAVLFRARAAAGPADRDRVAVALVEGRVPAMVLALDRFDEHPALPTVVLDLWLEYEGLSEDLPGLRLIGPAAANRCPERVPPLLADPGQRDLGLALAPFVATEEVVEALLSLPVPGAPEDRAAYLHALASTGDAACLPTLAAVAEAWPAESVEAVRLARALHPGAELPRVDA